MDPDGHSSFSNAHPLPAVRLGGMVRKGTRLPPVQSEASCYHRAGVKPHGASESPSLAIWWTLGVDKVTPRRTKSTEWSTRSPLLSRHPPAIVDSRRANFSRLIQGEPRASGGTLCLPQQEREFARLPKAAIHRPQRSRHGHPSQQPQTIDHGLSWLSLDPWLLWTVRGQSLIDWDTLPPRQLPYPMPPAM
jgi:hypothetical protein